MKRVFLGTLITALAASRLFAIDGLYYIGSDAQEPLPIQWTVGMSAIWDDNVNPVGPGSGDSGFALNPTASVAFVNMDPQTTLDVYARVGALYYFDEPAGPGSDQLFPQFRGGLNYNRRISERLRFVSRNFIAYELEPDLNWGFANIRSIDPFLSWSTDNSVGYRWTRRFGTYTGITFSGTQFGGTQVESQNVTRLGFYNQFRYQLTPQTVLTGRYAFQDVSADGFAADATQQFLTVGVEHRFSPNTILVASAGMQRREVDGPGAGDLTAPFFQAALRSQINRQFSLRSFVRYSLEDFDTVRFVGTGTGLGVYNFDARETLRIGVQASYRVSPKLELFAGVDYLPATFDDGRLVSPLLGLPPGTAGALSEDLINLSVGASLQLTENLSANLTYNFTDSQSDFDFPGLPERSFERNRVSLGIFAQF